MKIVIIGCGGHGRVILDILQNRDEYQIAGFLDDKSNLINNEVDGVKVIGSTGDLQSLRKKGVDGLVIGIGDNHIRARLFKEGMCCGFEMINVVHPQAILSQNVCLGKGVVVMAGVVVNTGTVIKDNVCLNTGATIDHDNKLSEHVHVYPGATLTGGVTVGEYSYIGTNAAVNPYVKIGNNVVVGTGGAVISDVPDDVIVAGTPATILKRREANA